MKNKWRSINPLPTEPFYSFLWSTNQLAEMEAKGTEDTNLQGNTSAINSHQVRRISNYNFAGMLQFWWYFIREIVVIKCVITSILLKTFVILKKLHSGIRIHLLKVEERKRKMLLIEQKRIQSLIFTQYLFTLSTN